MLSRRDFMAASAGAVLATALGGEAAAAGAGGRATVALVRGTDRKTMVPQAIELLGINPVAGREVLVKPNFNTADPFPASTHNDTLEQLILALQRMGSSAITVGERCGPPDTAEVIAAKGADALCRRLDAGLINFEELPESDWVRIRPEQSHWRNGFEVARPVLEAERVVSTCCLKTHRYGGVFTMSLKLSVGITHKRNMGELHGAKTHMRRMIAEINQAYAPALVLMDGIEVFTDGGPMEGTRKRAEVMVAGTDRIAVDAVGLAILKELGANRAIMETRIFAQEQIVRAVELGLGVGRPEDIDIVADAPASRRYAEKILAILHREAATA